MEKIEIQKDTQENATELLKTPEGREYFDAVFKRDHKLKQSTSVSQKVLEKDLKTKVETYSHFDTMRKGLLKNYDVRESNNQGKTYKMTEYLDKMDKTNLGISNNVLKAYDKLLFRF